MANAYYQKGQTVKLSAEFRNFDGILADPEIVKFKLYDITWNLKKEETITITGKVSTGKYEYFLSVDTVGNFHYEFYGEIEAKPCLKRKAIIVKMI